MNTMINLFLCHGDTNNQYYSLCLSDIISSVCSSLVLRKQFLWLRAFARFRTWQLRRFRTWQLRRFRTWQLRRFRTWQLRRFRTWQLRRFRTWQLRRFRTWRFPRLPYWQFRSHWHRSTSWYLGPTLSLRPLSDRKRPNPHLWKT